MTVRVERESLVTTVVFSRPEARNDVEGRRCRLTLFLPPEAA
ncbi:hypothetical protein [Nonomuraea glycinis]|nr:hypothetical protein [Nonomuraea glycinis]